MPLDIEHPESLLEYLRLHGHISGDERPEFRVLTGGVSNRTVWVRRPNGQSWVLKQALEKLRVEADWFSNPERIHREAAGLRWLIQLVPIGTIPELVFEDTDAHLLAMQAVPEPHDNWKTQLLKGKVNFDYIRQFGQLLAMIQRGAYEKREQIAREFEDRSFFESLRIEPYYLYTATSCVEAADFLTDLVQETRNTIITLTHGDYSPKNVLVYQDRLVLLDHEVIHFGDPAFDLGFSMTHLLSKAHHLKSLRLTFADATKQYWQSYTDVLGNLPWTPGLEARAVRHTLACLLARVAGKSPLEYLSLEERLTQQKCVLMLMNEGPVSVPDLVDRFIGGLPQ